jgi:hypothetical protein
VTLCNNNNNKQQQHHHHHNNNNIQEGYRVFQFSVALELKMSDPYQKITTSENTMLGNKSR